MMKILVTYRFESGCPKVGSKIQVNKRLVFTVGAVGEPKRLPNPNLFEVWVVVFDAELDLTA